MIKVGIVGATGYTGVELLRLLAPRQDLEIAVVTSRALCGTAVSERFPNLRGHIDLDFVAPDAEALGNCDVVFFATAVYGLPEVNREQIQSAQLIAVPGCYPTAIQLGFLPLLQQQLVDCGRLIADAKSGVSGAGRKAVEDYLLCEAAESIRAYAVSGHRHHPEITQGLDRYAEAAVGLTFIPHLTPMIRGILATLYAPVKTATKVSIEQLQSIFEDRYRGEPFVEVLPQGELPATRDVKASNNCKISVNYSSDTDTIVVLVAIDNLVKGASGQAIQNMNIMFQLEETAGLEAIALLP